MDTPGVAMGSANSETLRRGVAEMTAGLDRAWEVRLGETHIVFGEGALDRLGERTAAHGISRAFVVTDPGVRRAGHLDRGVAALTRAGVQATVFDEVASNPTTGHVERGTEAARVAGIDGIVGIGGGSAMDVAKGVNFLLTGGGRMEDYWGRGKATAPMLPSVGVPTTAGTGSEAQSFTLISQEATGVKMACGDPKATFRSVILDPELTASVPRDVVAATGIDAITHALESYVSRAANPLSRLFAREAWSLLSRYFAGVLDADGGAPEARAGMLLGAFLAGGSIELSMLGAAHACANPLTARYGVTHGHAVGLMMPHVIRHNEAAAGTLYAELGASAPLLIDRFCELRSRAGTPERLSTCGVPRDGLSILAHEAAAQWTAGFNPAPAGAGEMLELYEAAY